MKAVYIKEDIYTVLMVILLLGLCLIAGMHEMFHLSIMYVKQEMVSGKNKLAGFI